MFWLTGCFDCCEAPEVSVYAAALGKIQKRFKVLDYPRYLSVKSASSDDNVMRFYVLAVGQERFFAVAKKYQGLKFLWTTKSSLKVHFLHRSPR